MEEIKIIRGDTATLAFPITNKTGQGILLSDIDTLILTCRNKYYEMLFNKNKEDFRFEDNKCKVDLNPEDTEQINCSNPIYFDIEVTLKNGTRKSKLCELKLMKDYTTHGGDENGN